MSEPHLFNTPPTSPKLDCYYDQIVEEDEAGLLQVTCTLTYQAQVTIMPPRTPAWLHCNMCLMQKPQVTTFSQSSLLQRLYLLETSHDFVREGHLPPVQASSKLPQVSYL